MFDPAVVNIILAGALGLTVVGVTETIKKWLHATGILAWIVSILVSAAGTLYYLISTATFTWPLFIGYTIFVTLSANGIYKATHGPTG